MTKEFDQEEAKKFLANREGREKEEHEKARKILLEQVISILKQEFNGSSAEVYLVGSILKPFAFSPRSDVDIVLKNYGGDRFDLWTRLEKKIPRSVEIILFETCPFQDFVLKDGFRVV